MVAAHASSIKLSLVGADWEDQAPLVRMLASAGLANQLWMPDQDEELSKVDMNGAPDCLWLGLQPVQDHSMSPVRICR